MQRGSRAHWTAYTIGSSVALTTSRKVRRRTSLVFMIDYSTRRSNNAARLLLFLSRCT